MDQGISSTHFKLNHRLNWNNVYNYEPNKQLCFHFKGHDLQNPATKITHGYCAAPDKNCFNETPMTSKEEYDLEQNLEPRNNFNYQRNTGVVNCRVNSGLKYKKRSSWSSSNLSNGVLSNGVLSESVASQVFAHEVGHSFGARHDDSDVTCNPSRIDNYIMTGMAKVTGYTVLFVGARSAKFYS